MRLIRQSVNVAYLVGEKLAMLVRLKAYGVIRDYCVMNVPIQLSTLQRKNISVYYVEVRE